MLYYVIMLSVAGGNGLVVGGGIEVKDPDIEEGTFQAYLKATASWKAPFALLVKQSQSITGFPPKHLV